MTPLLRHLEMLRERAGLSKSELCAHILQIPRPTYYRWLRNETYPKNTQIIQQGILKLEGGLKKNSLPLHACLTPPKFPSQEISSKRAAILQAL